MKSKTPIDPDLKSLLLTHPDVVTVGNIYSYNGGFSFVTVKLHSGRWSQRSLKRLLGDLGVKGSCQVCGSEINVAVRFCEICLSEKSRACQKAYHLKNTYDLTLKQWEEMMESQKGVCAICGTPPRRRDLDVEHDHVTGRIRGLVCLRCNLAIWWFEKYQEKVLKYL
jgi:hypothetical protein